MNTEIQTQIAVARAKLDAVSAELRALEERAIQEANKPWEPKGGRFFFKHDGGIAEGGSTLSWRLSGSEYPTEKAAESALQYVTFFKRLCCLAQELNPSGKVGGIYYVMPRRSEWFKAQISSDDRRDIACVFETAKAADAAAEIMTRDKWKVPSI